MKKESAASEAETCVDGSCIVVDAGAPLKGLAPGPG